MFMGLFNKDQKNSKEDFKSLFESIADAVFIADSNSKKLIDCNKQAEKLIGYSREEILTMKADQLHPKDWVKRTMEDFKKHAKGKPSVIETEVLTKDKKRIPVSINSSVIELAGKSCLCGIFRDITERKKIDKELRRSEEKYKELYQGAPIGLYEIDFAKRKFVEVNDTMCEYMGVSREELLKMRPFDFLTKQSKIKFLKRLALMKLGKEVSHEVDFEIKNKKGEFMSIRIYTQDVVKNGKIVGAKVVAQNITEQKKARGALQDSEDLNKLITENTSDLISMASFNINPTFFYVSPSHKRVLGYLAEDLIDKPCFDFIHSDDKKRLFLLLKRYISLKAKKVLIGEELKISEKIEYRIKDKKGHWHNLESTVDFLGNKLLFVSRDITERKQMEEKLKESEEKFKILLENAPVGIYYNDFTGKFLYGNKRAEEITGYQRSELIGQSFLKLKILKTSQLPRAAALLAKNKMGKGTGPDMFVINCKDGSEKYVEISTRIIEVAGEKKVLGMVNDISGRKQAEEKIVNSAKEWSETFDSMADGVSLHSSDFTIVNANRSLSNILNKTREELIGKKYFSIFHDKDKPIAECPMKATLESKREKRAEIFEPKLDKWLSIYTSPIINKDGQVVKIIHVVRDITKRKQAEKAASKRNIELEKANKLMVGRELKMIELKKKIKELSNKNG